MHADGGYTRQYRRLWDNPIFRNKQEAAVFSWMKDAAAWKPTAVKTRFGTVTLAVGELLIAERAVAEDFGIDRKRLRNLLSRMVQDGMISLSGPPTSASDGTIDGTIGRANHGTIAGTIVTIQKYTEYQGLRVVGGVDQEPLAEPLTQSNRDHCRDRSIYNEEEERIREELPPVVPPSPEPETRRLRRSAKHEVPEDWFPTEEGVAYAAEKAGWWGCKLDDEVEHFRDHHRSNGKTFADDKAAWRTWVRNGVKFGARNRNGRHSAHADETAAFDAITRYPTIQ